MGLLAKIRQQGAIYFLGEVFNRIVPEWLFRYGHMAYFVIDVDSFPGLDEKPDGDVVVGWADTSQKNSALRQLTYCHPDIDPQNLHAVKAEIDGQLAGGLWAAVGLVDEKWMGVRLELKPAQGWLFSARVANDFRRHGVYSCILRFICTGLCQQGLDYLVLAVSKYNVASLRAHQKHARFSPGTITAIRLFGMTFCRTTDRVCTDRNWTWNCKTRPIVVRFE